MKTRRGLFLAGLGFFVSSITLPAQSESPSKLRVPEGFVIEKVAGEPGIKFPMFATFDDRGRLYVAESSGGDLYVEISKLAPTCRVSVLEDRDGDGRFELARIFADKLVFPMGLVWRDGKLYLAEASRAITLEDTDDDGRADKRTTILTGFGHSDNGSLHGLIFGPDGLLYMTVGQPDGYHFKAADGTEVRGRTGALIRCRPDGSHPEVLCRGFENLVEIVFLPTGEIVGDDNWFQLPSGGVRDALVHLVEGGKYPRMADNGTPLPVTGGDLPAIATFPAVAFSGLMQYRGERFPPEMRENLFSAQHNTRCVQRHLLIRESSTFSCQSFDFVTSDDPDFRPADVLEAPDGSLLIVDTGGWYVQHCPTGRMRPSAAVGGIYRVRYTGAAAKGEGAGRELDALWTSSAAVLRQSLDDGTADERALAARILGFRKEAGFARPLDRLLAHEAPHVHLAAAEALAHCGDAESLPAIWQALGKEPDRFFEHALIFAAMRLADEKMLRSALASANARVQKAALLLLDQGPHRSLSYPTVFQRLSSKDTELQRIAMQILQQHPEWAGEAVGFIRESLEKPSLADDQAKRLEKLILAFQAQPLVQNLIASLITNRDLPPARRAMLLETLAQSGLKEVPAAWIEALNRTLADSLPMLQARAVQTISVLQLQRFDAALVKLTEDEKQSPEIRLEALRGIIARHPRLSARSFIFLAAELEKDSAALNRLGAAQILARAKLDETQQATLRQISVDDPLVSPLLFPRAATTTEEQRALLTKYEPLLLGGDPARGREVYFGKVFCGTCHQVGGDGGAIGPDLTKIGAIRSGRDLLESIVFPSSTFAQGYESYSVSAKDGTVVSGIVARQTAEMVVLRDPSGAEQRFPREHIQTLERSSRSLMPEGLDRVLTAEEFRDLLSFLQSLR